MTGFLEGELRLGDISDSANVSDWGVIGLAVFLVDLFLLALVRSFPTTFGKSINLWYDSFGLAGVLYDVTILLLGIALTRTIYTTFYAESEGFNPWTFLWILLWVQVLHDLVFYAAVIKPFPEGANEMMDVFKSYAAEGKWKIVVADAATLVGCGFLAMVLKEWNSSSLAVTGIVGAYLLPFLLFTRTPYSVQ